MLTVCSHGLACLVGVFGAEAGKAGGFQETTGAGGGGRIPDSCSHVFISLCTLQATLMMEETVIPGRLWTACADSGGNWECPVYPQVPHSLFLSGIEKVGGPRFQTHHTQELTFSRQMSCYQDFPNLCQGFLLVREPRQPLCQL